MCLAKIQRTSAYYLKRTSPFIALFLLLELVFRTVLLVHERTNLDGHIGDIAHALLAGVIMDVGTLTYFLLPFALYLLILPARCHGTRKDKVMTAIGFGAFAYLLLFTRVGEWFFWDEFQARFNFIAVDYLVYTHEVIGNIQESYPVYPLFAAIAALVGGLAYFQYRTSRIPAYAPVLHQRLSALVVMGLIAATSFYTLKSSIGEVSENRYLNQIAHNGIFEIFSAFRNNDLSYEQFYTTADQNALLKDLRADLGIIQDTPDATGITRTITADAPETPYNVVMITVESLSAKYMKMFGNTQNITPNLDALVNKSLFFTNLYATGTRTVYGLSSLTLSIPPIPGNSIVRRPENEGLFSLGAVLNRKGYDSKFIYGGYGYFDNMNAFFAGNGYQILDRNSFTKEEINFANVWGICDGDVFTRTLKESDASHAKGKPFFQMVMTTSNHRPYTYPEGKIDLPSKSGRAGGVKYTDYAIAEFLKQAESHPWFDNTLFVVVADHTAGSAGKSDLNPPGYHIPMFIYAPKLLKPGRVNKLISQIDVAPTLLGLMNMSYASRFYGKNVLKESPERAFISNYQSLGYLTDGKLAVLKPIKKQDFYTQIGEQWNKTDVRDEGALHRALMYFQTATQWKTWSKDIPTP
jgi:phosphoglycerol transferase MdoB-like AlkP superfamily enzyme